MGKSEILERTKNFVYDACKVEGTGHDFWHIQRVYQNAMKINEEERKDSFLISMTAYLHDLYDHKFCKDNPQQKLENLLELLDEQNELKSEEKKNIIDSCLNLGYSANILEKKNLSEEGKIVQDADRLDALGAIAIARTFVYSGATARPIYDPTLEKQGVSREEYQKSGSKTGIGHFYDKVLRVKEKMNTKSAKKMAEKRHEFVEIYLQEFLDEWEGRK